MQSTASSIFRKTFGGLSPHYYFRQFVFGLSFAALLTFMMVETATVSIPMILVLIVNTALYPYARFVYESVVDFITGRHVLFVNALLLLGWKVMTMALCWTMAMFIAPIGLAYLFWHHSRPAAPG